MRIAILGYGRMGKTIERIAVQRGHKVTLIVGSRNQESFTVDSLENVDVAIEFSTPETAFENLKICSSSKTPAVCGTTGWLEHLPTIEQSFKENEIAFIYASNFSVGVNLFFEINQKLAALMNKHQNFKASTEETHHIHKVDAPSGTAITIAEQIIENHDEYKNWINKTSVESQMLPIISYREGEIYGNHSVQYESEIDLIKLSHVAKSRDGFALGAVLAAEHIVDKSGIFTMKDVLGIN